MQPQEALAFANSLIKAKTGRYLSSTEQIVFLGSWQGQTYKEIAKANNLSAAYLNQEVGIQVWRLLSESLGENISKKNLKNVLESRLLTEPTQYLNSIMGKAEGESGIKLLGDIGEKIGDGTGKLTQKAQNLIALQYIENYTKHHGILKVLGMSKPVSLDSVYTAVELLNPEELRTFESVEGLESAFRTSKQRGFQSQEFPKQLDIDVANREQYLMVLGAPGMGKTTFLRKVGLEALKRNKGAYEPNCIPVFLELKKFRTGEISFEKAIAAEFANCGLPEYQQLTAKFLEQGKLLILLDGLDEVPTERMSEIVTEIQNFVDRHSKNRFITSCRIAAYRNNFRRFTDVAIADFDDEQIQNFVTNWFETNPERGKECLEGLNSGDYQAAKELTRTPLLLTLVCILYQRSGQFPINRSTLYDRALRVLLEEWNSAKEIPIEPLYKGLDTKRKELILSQIAYDTFIEDRLFFPKRDVVKQIEKLLPELLPEEKIVDGNDVLRDIEVQHGLLVERAESIYSFSHLTIQEFLTAQHIDYNDIPIEKLINNHLCDKRWREVFLLLAGLRKADNLLLAMEKKIHSLMNTPKLHALLVWVEHITDSSSGDIQPIGKRAISLAYANTNANADAYAIANPITNAYAIAIKIANANADAYAIANADAIAIAYINAIANAYATAYAYAYADAIKKFIKYGEWSEEYQIYQSVSYTELIADLNELETQIPKEQEPREIRQAFSQKLIEKVLSAFQLTPDMVNLSESELEKLDNYFYATWLMIQCKQAAVRVSSEVWKGIESRMLLPVKNHQP